MNEEINSTQNLLRQILSTFFIHIKEVREPRSESPTNNISKTVGKSASDSEHLLGISPKGGGHGAKGRNSVFICQVLYL